MERAEAKGVKFLLPEDVVIADKARFFYKTGPMQAPFTVLLLQALVEPGFPFIRLFSMTVVRAARRLNYWYIWLVRGCNGCTNRLLRNDIQGLVSTASYLLAIWNIPLTPFYFFATVRCKRSDGNCSNGCHSGGVDGSRCRAKDGRVIQGCLGTLQNDRELIIWLMCGLFCLEGSDRNI